MVEGQIHRLKLLKRQMYGRAGFDLLRLHVLNPVKNRTRKHKQTHITASPKVSQNPHNLKSNKQLRRFDRISGSIDCI